MESSCARCGGPTHRLNWDDALDSSYPPGVGQVSHWCIGCMEEEWPSCRLDGRYGLVWKLVTREDFPPQHKKESLIENRYRGMLGALYRVDFPSVLLPPLLSFSGICNFLLSPLGALKELHTRSPWKPLGKGGNWTLLALIVPWDRVILRSDLVLQGDLFMPHLPVLALDAASVAKQGLTPGEAVSLLDALPESSAWLTVHAWEKRLRPEVLTDWLRLIQAAESLAWGLAPLRLLFLYFYDMSNLVTRLHAQPGLREQRKEMQERLQRFLSVLAQELFQDGEREERYRKLRSKGWRLVSPTGAPSDATEILWRNPKTDRIEGRFDPLLELEVLMSFLRDDEVDVWVCAIEKAIAAVRE